MRDTRALEALRRGIGAARGRRKLDVAREAGAEVTLDYSEPGWAKHVHEITACRRWTASHDVLV
jgi:NADPH:quinone reductase-like Zn-dependent oxidoreductase